MAGRDDFTSGASSSEQPYFSRALLLKRDFGIDVTRCDCGAPFRRKAVIEDPDCVRSELHRLGLWSEPPTTAKAKPSAHHEDFDFDCDSG